MSSVSSPCSQSEANLLFEKGLRDLQNQRTLERKQEQIDLRDDLAMPEPANALTNHRTVAEPNKGFNIDVYV